MYIGIFMRYSVYPAKPTPGFTLVELVVTFAILVVISVGVIIQFQTLSPTQSLENASDIFRSTFVDTRTNAVANQKCCSDVTPSGYGLTMTLDGSPDYTVIAFADLDGDHLYTAADTILNTVILPDTVDITECSTPTTSVTTGSCTIVLETGSNGGIYYNGVTASETMTFELTERNAGSTTSLNVYPQGFVIE